MNLDAVIQDILGGTPVRDVLEDLTKAAAQHAASLVRWDGMSKEAAAKKAEEVFGYPPDDDLLHTATNKSGVVKKGPKETGQHWVKTNMWDPTKEKK